jgi:hypothetical protein
MTKLNQILAIEKREKTSLNEFVTRFYHRIGRVELLQGMTRTYEPRDSLEGNPDQETFPAETVRVQVNVEDELKKVAQAFVRLLDVEGTKDWTNTRATADIVLEDGTTLLVDVPVTYMLWLEKQLVDLETIALKLPTLNPMYRWVYDENMNAYGWAENVLQRRTKKVPEVLVKYPATDKHPAQTEVYQKDVETGTYSKREFSGAIPASKVTTLLGRIRAVQRAVKMAREQANMVDVIDPRVGQQVIDYIFAD